MKRNLIIGGVAVVVVAAVIAYVAMQPKAEVKPTVENTETATAATGTPMTLKKLLGLQSAQVCTFSSDFGEVSSKGTVYAAGGKVRSDVESQTQAGLLSSHLISDGVYANVWTSALNHGFRLKIDETQPTVSAKSNVPDINQSFNMDCKPWTVDASVFVAPANITFREMTLPKAN